MKKFLVIVLCMAFMLSFSIPAAALTTVPVTGIQLDTDSVFRGIGGTYALKVTLTPAKTTQKFLAFSTSNKNVATVDANGKITGVAAGTATITVTSASNKNISAKCTVTIMKPITFTMYAGEVNANWMDMKDEVGKEITRQTGVTLKVDYSVGDQQQKVALLAASGNYPDFLACGWNNLLVDAGAYIDLTKMIDKYAPNTKRVYGKYLVRQQWSLADRSIYVLANTNTIDSQSFDAIGGFELQYAVLKELNYPNIRTLGQYESAIKQYITKYPTINGKPTIGLSLNTDDWHSYFSYRDPAKEVTGKPGDGEWYIDPKTYKCTQHYLVPDEREFYRWLNHMNAVGLMDPESFTQKGDQYKAKMSTGRILAVIDQEWDYNDGEAALRTAGMGDRAYAHLPVVTDLKYKRSDFAPVGFSAGDGTGISVDCKDPVRAIRFLDYLASDEGQILNMWGIKDLHYKVNEKGIRYIPDDIQNQKTNNSIAFTKKTGIGQYRFTIHYGDGVKDSTGSYYTTNFPEQIVKAYPQEEREILKHYNATTWKDLFPAESAFQQRPYGAAWTIPIPADSELNIINQKMIDTVMKRLPEAILAKPADFDATFDKFIAEMKADGCDRAGELFSGMVKDKILQWSKID